MPFYPYSQYKGKIDLNPQLGWYVYGYNNVIQIDKIVKSKKEYIGHYYNDSSRKSVTIKQSEILEITNILDEKEEKLYMQNSSEKWKL